MVGALTTAVARLVTKRFYIALLHLLWPNLSRQSARFFEVTRTYLQYTSTALWIALGCPLLFQQLGLASSGDILYRDFYPSTA